MGYMAKGQKEQVVLVEWELRPPSIRMFECQPCHMATNADERRRDDPGADFLKRAMRENRRSSVPTFDRRNRCLHKTASPDDHRTAERSNRDQGYPCARCPSELCPGRLLSRWICPICPWRLRHFHT